MAQLSMALPSEGKQTDSDTAQHNPADSLQACSYKHPDALDAASSVDAQALELTCDSHVTCLHHRVPEAGNFTAGGRGTVRRRAMRRALREEGLVVRSRSKRSRRSRFSGVAGDISREHSSLDTTPNVVEAAALSKERSEALKAELETQRKGAATLVFVAHTRASDVLFRDWMVDPRRRGPLVFDYGPFDHVLATSGVHDVFVFDSVDEYEKQLGESAIRGSGLSTGSWWAHVGKL